MFPWEFLTLLRLWNRNLAKASQRTKMVPSACENSPRLPRSSCFPTIQFSQAPPLCSYYMPAGWWRKHRHRGQRRRGAEAERAGGRKLLAFFAAWALFHYCLYCRSFQTTQKKDWHVGATQTKKKKHILMISLLPCLCLSSICWQWGPSRLEMWHMASEDLHSGTAWLHFPARPQPPLIQIIQMRFYLNSTSYEHFLRHSGWAFSFRENSSILF